MILHEDLARLPAEAWDACVGPDHPLMRHGHLALLQATGVAVPDKGFSPCPIEVPGAGFVPAWLKDHSQGELGVDLGLPLAHARSCGPYYPKLQVEVPMVPFAGPRLLATPGPGREARLETLARALIAARDAGNAASVQVAQIADPAEVRALEAAGFIILETNTFDWHHVPSQPTAMAGLESRLTGRRASELRRSRRKIAAEGLSFRHLRGAALTPEIAARFYPFYRENFDRHDTAVWLPEAYFTALFATMAGQLDLSLALRDGQWVGACLAILGARGGQSLYWGSLEPIRFLHFELVYHRGAERGHLLGLDWLDFSATGPHKAARGLLPRPQWTAFHFRDPGFADVARAGAARKTALARAEREALRATTFAKDLRLDD